MKYIEKNYVLKAKLVVILILIVFTSSELYSQTESILFNKLNSLYNQKQFFRLRTELKSQSNLLNESEKDYFNSLTKSVFNKPEESNRIIDKLMKENPDKLTDSMIVELLECRLINSVNLFDYSEAGKTTELLLSKYGKLIEPDDIKDFENSALIWKAGSDLKGQKVTITGDTRLELKRDLANLANIKVNIYNFEEDFIFDTGANFSTVSKSFAVKLGLKFIEGTIDVGTSTDKKVKSEIAYADSLRIGNLSFENVAFLVLPDEDLTFAGGMYVINGIIGFPVIKEMKEIVISEKEIFIPAESVSSSYENLTLDGFIPLVETIVNSDTLIFSFDTGARSTIMYFPYYEKNKSEIDKLYMPEDIEFAGAGGETVVKGFNLNNMDFQIASGKTMLNEVSLLSKHIKDNDEFIYGNLGGDFIGKFSKMIINFDKMYVEFEK